MRASIANGKCVSAFKWRDDCWSSLNSKQMKEEEEEAFVGVILTFTFHSRQTSFVAISHILVLYLSIYWNLFILITYTKNYHYNLLVLILILGLCLIFLPFFSLYSCHYSCSCFLFIVLFIDSVNTNSLCFTFRLCVVLFVM